MNFKGICFLCVVQIFAWTTELLGIDYTKLSHRVFVDSLRAGNHDESGLDEYYFMLKLRALKNTADDQALALASRMSVSRDPVEFGALAINVLTDWEAPKDKIEEALATVIEGDTIRQLVAEAMRVFAVAETEVGVEAEIEMYEKNKRFYFFGTDTLIGANKYYPLPINKDQPPMRTNLKLEISDAKGAKVQFKVKYD